MSRHDQIAPIVDFPSQATIDRAIARGKSLRTRAILETVGDLFAQPQLRR